MSKYLFKETERPVGRVVEATHVSSTSPVEISKTTHVVTELDDSKMKISTVQDVEVREDRVNKVTSHAHLESDRDGFIDALAGMSGSPYIVDYYQQYLGQDDEVSSYSEDRISPLQQYRKIAMFEIRVTSSWSYSHDEETQIDNLTGTGAIYPVLKPNVGDVFVADIGDGRYGLCEISSVRKMSHRKFSAYEVDYFVRDYYRPEVEKDLNQKVIDEYLFDKSRMENLLEPFVPMEQVYRNIELEKHCHRLIESWFKQFFDVETSSVSVPVGTTERVYDVSQMWFIDSIIDKLEYPQYRRIRLQVATDEIRSRHGNIWEAILARDWMLLDNAGTHFHLMESVMLKNVLRNFNGYHSLYKKFIVPRAGDGASKNATVVRQMSAPAEIPVVGESDYSINARYIYDIDLNGNYIFSHYFYTEDVQKMSRLEGQVYRYLKGLDIDAKLLQHLAHNSHRWSDLERYYLQPVLVFLMMRYMDGL